MQKPNVNDTSLFICQLPQDIQEQIKHDLEVYALENGITLEVDEVTGEYLAMQDRFCNIEDIYNITESTVISTLPKETQDEIINEVIDYHFCNGNGILTNDDIETVLNSSLGELENVIDLENYLWILNESNIL